MVTGRVRGLPGVVRSLTIAAAVLWVVILLGCMSLSFGGRCCDAPCLDEPFCQEGENRLTPGGVQLVYYPIPFGSPPNLELEDPLGQYVLVEQHADHFRVQNHGGGPPLRLRWKARGLRAVLPPQPPPLPTHPPTLPPPAVAVPATP